MNRWMAACRYDAMLQARHGFYAATTVIVVIVGGLLVAIPAAARANAALWVPALIVVNLPITTFFFVSGLILLEREEGTLTALGVTPVTAGDYLATRMTTLVALAVAETLVIAAIGFRIESPLIVIAGATLLGIMLTGFGAGMGARYATVNEMILPGSVLVTVLLLPLLAHFGLMPRMPFLLHPVEPPLTIIRAGYAGMNVPNLVFSIAGSLAWCALAWWWGRASLAALMRSTEATGGR